MSDTLDPRFEAELRRGVVQMVALHLLREPRYGYDLVRLLGNAGFPVEEGTLYPILRRLEKQGALGSTWNTEGSRPRKYYVLNAEGEALLAAMQLAWREVRDRTDGALDGTDPSVEPQPGADPAAGKER
jgi:DNA-binding PadR family transcriptional regulator